MSSLLVFNRVYRPEIQSVMLAFLTELWELLPQYPSLWFTSPTTPPPVPQLKYSIRYTCSVWLGGGVVLSCVGD
jgi:hypothetical protein